MKLYVGYFQKWGELKRIYTHTKSYGEYCLVPIPAYVAPHGIAFLRFFYCDYVGESVEAKLYETENRITTRNVPIIVYRCIPGTIPRKFIEWSDYVRKKTRVDSSDF